MEAGERSRALDRLQQWRNVSSDGDKSLTQGFAEPATEHKIQLIMQQLGQVRPHSLCEHAHTLKDRLFLRCILLPVGHAMSENAQGSYVERTPWIAILTSRAP